MNNIQDILTKHNFLLLSILAIIIVFLSVLLRTLISQSNQEPVILKYVDKKTKPNRKPIIKMALAADNIEDIERSITNKKNTIEEQNMKNQTVLENVLKAMNEDLEKERYAKIDAYEEEQEKEAVISYQELRNKMMKNEEEVKLNKIENSNYNKELYDILDTNEKDQIITPYEYDFNFDYKLKEDETALKSSYDNTLEKNETIEEPTYNHTFESNEFISPIYGKMDNNQIYSEIEKNDSVKDLSLASDTDEFLNTLKEFRNSL